MNIRLMQWFCSVIKLVKVNTALRSRRHKKRIAALLMLPVMVLQPLLVAAEVVLSGAGNTQLDAAPNGVPMVNIATPNGAGVSHNIYQQFDLDTQGLILNNATAISQTQLGGFINANANLTQGSAGMVLNEVIGAAGSSLNGYLEVGGARADVIVANPYGITCNGCGFINTHRATLTTGQSLFNASGGLEGFAVQGGTVRFEGLGLNANNIDRVDVLARAVSLNAELYARTLNLIAGQQTVNYADLSLSNTSTDDTAPTLAIDSTQLGGIYADRIRLVSSETGVGVNLEGPVAALTGDLSLSANGDLRYKALSSQQNLELDVSGRIQAEGDATAAGSITMKADELLNLGLIFSLAQVDLSIDTLLQNGNDTLGGAIMAVGDISIRDSDADNPDLVVENNGSWIEALTGNMTITADQVLNRRTGLDIQRNVLDYANAWSVYNTIYYSRITPFVGDPPYPFVRWTNDDSISVAIGSDDQLIDPGSPAVIKAAGNIDISASRSVINATSYLLAGGDIHIDTGLFDNLPEKLYRRYREYYFDYDNRSGGECSYGRHCEKGDGAWGFLGINQVSLVDDINSIVAATGTLTINGTQAVTNGQPEDYILSNPYADTVEGSLPSSDPLALLNNPLFHLSQNPNHPYLIESNPVFANYQSFISSAYLLDRLGWNPDESVLLLGDGAYELYWLREQLLNENGGLYLSADFSDEQEQFQYLMDNAVTAREDLQLAPGVALSAEQLNNLQDDMVWLVEQDIKGQKVLLPTLYLSHAHERLTPQGAIIAGKDIDITAGSIDNAGSLLAQHSLALTSVTGSITHTGGTLHSEGLLALQSAEDIANLSGIIQGDIVNLQAQRNISIQTLAEQQHFGREGMSRYETLVGDTASITGGQVMLNAGSDILLQAARLNAGMGGATLTAGKDITLATQVLANGHEYLGDNTRVQHRVEHLSTDIQSGGNLNINAGHNLTGVGVNLQAAGDLGLYAQQDMAFVSAINSDYSFQQKTADKAYGEKVKSHENYSENAITSHLTAGGNLLINTVEDHPTGHWQTTDTQGNVLLAGVQTLAAEDTVAYAGNDLLITATETQSYSHSETRRHYSDLALGAGSLVGVSTLGIVDVELKGNASKGQTNTHLTRSQLDSGGDTVLLSGHNTTLVAGDLFLDNLIAQAGLNTDLGEGHITLMGAHETSSHYETESTLDLGMNIDGGRLTLAEQTETRQSQSQQNYLGTDILALNNLELDTRGDVNIIGSNLNAGLDHNREGALNINASGQVNLLSASNINQQTNAATTRTLMIESTATGSDASIFAGYEEIHTENQATLHTAVTSNLGANNLHINSGTDINLNGATLQAHDLTLQAAGDINTDSAVNTDSLMTSQEQRRVGVQVAAHENYTAAENAVNGVGDAEGGSNKIFATLQAIDALITLTTIPISPSANVVAEYSRVETRQSSQTHTPSVLIADNNLTLNSGGDQHHQGTQAFAGNNLSLNAEGEIIIESVQNQYQNQQNQTSLSASIDLINPGASSMAAGYSNDRQNQNQHLNATFQAGQTLSLDSGGDTTLAGAVASGQNINARIGGDLKLISRQDTDTIRGEGANLGVSLAAGKNSHGLSIGGNHSEGDRAWVNQQTGLYANDSVAVYVDNHTQLIGSVINSDTGNLNLDTGTLSFSNINDSNRYNGTSLNIGLQISQGEAVNTAQNTGTLQTAHDKKAPGGSGTNSLSGSYESRDMEQLTRATVGLGQITVRGDSLNTNSTAGLNRDINLAQEITRDDDSHYQLYISDSSLYTLTDTLTDTHKLIKVLSPDAFLAETGANLISSLGTLDDALIAGLTLGQNQNGVLDDQAFLNNLAGDYYDATLALSDVILNQDETGTWHLAGLGDSNNFSDHFLRRQQGREDLTQARRVLGEQNHEPNNGQGGDGVDALNNANQYGIDTLQAFESLFVQTLTGDANDQALLYLTEGAGICAGADACANATNNTVGINLNRTDITDPWAHIEALAHESYHLILGIQDDHYSNLYAEQVADLWLISNTQENRQTGGIPGLSLDEWINQQDHLSTLHSNSQTFGLMNPAELEFRQLRVEEVAVIKDAVTAYADRYQLNDTEAKKELTQQALLMVDSGWAAKEHISENPRARALLENLSALEEPLNDWSRDKEFRLFTADTADYNDPYLYANHLGALETPWGGGSGNVFRRQDVEPGWISLYGMEEGQQALEIPGMFDSMGASASTSLNTLGQLWDAGNEQGWGHFMLATGEAVYDSAVLGLSDCMGTTDCLIPDFWDHGSVKERQQVDQLLQHQQGLLDTTGSAYWGGFLLPLELVGPGKAGKEVVATAVDGATTVALRNADIDLNLDWLEINADNDFGLRYGYDAGGGGLGADKTSLSYDISKWGEYGLPSDGIFSRTLTAEQYRAFKSGREFNFAGKAWPEGGYPNGMGFIGAAEEARGLATVSSYRQGLKLDYDPKYVLEFQLRDPAGLQNAIKAPYEEFVPGGKTGAGLKEWNFPGISSDDISNSTVRVLDDSL